VLRGCRMLPVGKITALTQVRMLAELTTFFGSLRRAQELVERAAVPWTRPPRDSFRLSGARAPVLQDQCYFVVGAAHSFQNHAVYSRDANATAWLGPTPAV
jgi:hypothetical protein